MSAGPDRTQPTRDTVLSPTAAAAALGGVRADALPWLRAAGLVYQGPGGREVVIWGDVLDALRRGVQVPPQRRRLAKL